MEQLSFQEQELAKKWLERREHRTLEVVEDSVKQRDDLTAPTGFILEDYLRLRLAAHLHIRARQSMGQGRMYNLCAVCQSAESVVEDLHAPFTPCDIDCLDTDVGEVQGSVFVNVVEVPEQGKRMMRSVVRLQPLDRCKGGLRQTVEPAFLHLNPEVDRVRTDRELVSGRGLVGRVGKNQSPNYMVQGGTQAEEEVSDHNGEIPAGVFGRELDRGKPSLRIVLMLNRNFALAVSEGFNLGAYSVEVILCPNRLENGAV